MQEIQIAPKKEFDTKHEIIELGFFVVIAVILSTAVVLFVGLYLKGFTDKDFQSQFLFYGPFIMFIIGVIAIKAVSIASQGKYADVIIHDPVTAPAFIGKFLPFAKNPFIMFILAFVVTGWLSFLGAVFNIVFLPIKQTVALQQLTPFAELVSLVEPAVTQESFGLFFAIGVELTIILFVFRKLNITNVTVYSATAIVLLPIINFLGWMGWHRLHYSGQEGSLLYSGFFGGIGTLVTLAFGTIIIFWVWHFNNNLFLALKTVYGNDLFLAYSIIGLILLTIIAGFVIYYSATNKRLGKRNG